MIPPKNPHKNNPINVHSIIRIWIVILLIFSTMQVIPFDEPLVENASAGSNHTLTTQEDFDKGDKVRVTTTSSGNVTLDTQQKFVVDNFFDESNISTKKNLIVNTTTGDIKLPKIINSIGGTANDYGYSVEQTSDGGYIICGYTQSYGGSDRDLWLLKTNSEGKEEWNKTFGGTLNDYGRSVNQTFDGGYIITGYTRSFGDPGSNDVWLIKTDSSGNEEWSKTYGDTGSDIGYSVQQTKNGSYIIAGYTSSYGIPSVNNVWLIRTNKTGTELWNRTFGFSGVDAEGQDVQQTDDGGYIITGLYLTILTGKNDLWLIKTNKTGHETWNRTYYGDQMDEGYSVDQTDDGGYIIAGYTNSYGFGGTYDVWLIKTNKTGHEKWNQTYGGDQIDYGYSVQQTTDGGYILTGTTKSYGVGGSYDLWLIKTNESGNETWNRTFGGTSSEYGYSVQQTTDGGYVVAGRTNTFGAAGSYDVWLIKTNATGSVDFTNGELTSKNLLAGLDVVSISSFIHNIANLSYPGEILVQFSQDNTTWYNSAGVLDGWDTLLDGLNSIGLTALGWSGPNFYYRLNFTSDTENSDVLYDINITYTQYKSNGTLESADEFSANGDVNWQTITWNSDVHPDTEIKFQIRTATTQAGLTSKNYIGPDGTASTNYTTSGETIYSGHDHDEWLQFIVYLNTSNATVSPILEDVTINYNLFPGKPTQTKPQHNDWLDDNTPTFNWTFFDKDGTQSGFQVQIASTSSFSSIDYDSGQQTSTNPYWEFSTGTIDDGTWYWRVRTKDDDGDWGPYSTEERSIKIDTTAPASFKPTADPSGWTTDNTPQISFSTTDAGIGVETDKYEVSIDNGTPVVVPVSPYTLPAQTDGSHNISVKAFDKLGHSTVGYVDVYIDTVAPEGFKPTADPSGWTTNRQPQISFSANDATSGIARYDIDINETLYPDVSSPFTPPLPLPDGDYNTTVYAYDHAGNSNDSFVHVFIDTAPPYGSFQLPPGEWISDNQPTVTFNAQDNHSGINRYEWSVD
ncbi:MAG: hypothetical protein JSV49_05640, partial [Thermoplasmata archaeon]